MHTQEVNEQFSLEQLVPFFQPIMDLNHDAVWCYECLARLVVPGQYAILPNEFLHLVEREQAIEQLTETIFHRSAEYFRNINVAWNINISTQDMQNPNLKHMLEDYLHNYPNPSRVSLELTAATAQQDLSAFENFLETCRGINVGVFIDHFGVTPDNVDDIINLPINGFKIDGNLVSHLMEHEDTKAFIELLIRRAGEKNIAIVAEHVESAEILKHCQDAPIRYAQGFYFSQPQQNAVV